MLLINKIHSPKLSSLFWMLKITGNPSASGSEVDASSYYASCGKRGFWGEQRRPFRKVYGFKIAL